MFVTVNRPRPPLDRFVEHVTFFSGYMPAHQREKLIPDGAIQIIVDMSERKKRLYESDYSPGGRDFRRAWISGMQLKPIIIEAQKQASLLIIRFRPGGAMPFLGLAAEGLNGIVEALDVVIGRAASLLRDRVLEAQSADGKMAAVEGWLMDQAGGVLEVDPLVAWLDQRLRHPVGLRVKDLAEEAGYSERQLRNIFHRRIGLGPKRYIRVRRFQSVLAYLVACDVAVRDFSADMALEGAALPRADWAGIAAQFGYADQSHLNMDFQQFVAIAPQTYLDAYRGLENYLPITVPPGV